MLLTNPALSEIWLKSLWGLCGWASSLPSFQHEKKVTKETLIERHCDLLQNTFLFEWVIFRTILVSECCTVTLFLVAAGFGSAHQAQEGVTHEIEFSNVSGKKNKKVTSPFQCCLFCVCTKKIMQKTKPETARKKEDNACVLSASGNRATLNTIRQAGSNPQ